MGLTITEYYKAFEVNFAAQTNAMTTSLAFRYALMDIERYFVVNERINPYAKLNGSMPMLKTLSQMREECRFLNRKWRGLICHIDTSGNNRRLLMELGNYNLSKMYSGPRKQFNRVAGFAEVLLDGIGLDAAGLDRPTLVLGFKNVFNWTEEEMIRDLKVKGKAK